MNKLVILAALVIGALAANCGTYKADTGDLFWGYMKTSAKVYCNLFTGYVYKIDFSDDFHDKKDYSDKRTVNHHIVYSLKKKDDQKNKDDAIYVTKLTTAKTRFYDYAQFKKNHALTSCTPEPGSKTYNMEDISCVTLGANRYAWVKEAKKDAFDTRSLFDNNKNGKREFYSLLPHNLLLPVLVRSNSFGGCWPWWLLVITIILAVVIISMIAVGVAALTSKKGAKKKGKK